MCIEEYCFTVQGSWNESLVVHASSCMYLVVKKYLTRFLVINCYSFFFCAQINDGRQLYFQQFGVTLCLKCNELEGAHKKLFATLKRNRKAL